MEKRTKGISKKEFVKRFTDLTVEIFSKMPPEEQEARLKAVERRVARIMGRADRPTLSQTPNTPATRLSGRNRHEAR